MQSCHLISDTKWCCKSITKETYLWKWFPELTKWGENPHGTINLDTFWLRSDGSKIKHCYHLTFTFAHCSLDKMSGALQSLKCIILTENCCISIQISMKFVLGDQLIITQNWSRFWPDIVQAPNHYLNQCWLHLQLDSLEKYFIEVLIKIHIFALKKIYVKMSAKMAAILFPSQWVNLWRLPGKMIQTINLYIYKGEMSFGR